MSRNTLANFETRELVTGFRSFIRDFPDNVESARDIAFEAAESYRGFDVGTVLFGIKPGVNGAFTVAEANYKVKHLEETDDEHADEIDEHDPELIRNLHEYFDIPRDIPKVCAEANTILGALEQAENSSLYIVGYVNAAQSDEQLIAGVTGVPTRTLPPCAYPCTKTLDRSPNTSNATIYSSVGLSENVAQFRNMRLLKQLHVKQEESTEDVPVIQFSRRTIALSLEYFDTKIASHNFSERLPSRMIAAIARSALNQAYLNQ